MLIALLTATIALGQVRAAVVDTGLQLNDPRFTGLLCPTRHKDFTNTTIQDTHGHGTFVAGLIKQYAQDSDYCLLIYKYFLGNKGNLEREIEAIKEAIVNKASVINFSGGGNDYSEEEYRLIKDNPNVTFIVAAGNQNQNLDSSKTKFYPASYRLNNIIAVGSNNMNGKRARSSNYGGFLVWEVGENVEGIFPYGGTGTQSGTSMSTAIRTGKWLNFFYGHGKL